MKKKVLSRKRTSLTNSDIAELLAKEAESASPPLDRALRRAARRAFLWPEEATAIVNSRRALTGLSGIGPYLAKIIKQWIEWPPLVSKIPPIRENFLTLTDARAVLAKNSDLGRRVKDDLQIHSTWSDGTASIEEMAEAACGRSYEYIAITDHAKGLKIAGGIDEIALQQQSNEIEAINQKLKASGRSLHILRSIELNLNPRGAGDMDESSLAQLDIVLGCFHSSLRKTEDQTDRYLAALRNRTIQILGLPRGRIYNYRFGLHADWPRVFSLAAKLDKAVEIDCYPDRQDLSFDLLSIAKAEDCRISLGTDAHGPSQLAFLEFGLASATLAEISPERVINTMTGKELLRWAKSVRG